MEADEMLIAEAYDTLASVAQRLGFDAEVQLIQQRADDWNQPFMLYVLGGPKAGKSTIINRLAGRSIAAEDAQQPWINRYRFASPASERAEVRFEGAEAPKIMSVTQARVLARTRLMRPENRGSIQRIDWFLHIPEMPKQVVLVEAPLEAEADIPVAYGWLADAILWVMPVQDVGKDRTRQRLEDLAAIKNPKVPTLGVVTHMDTVVQSEWSSMLEKARTEHQAVLDHFVPAAQQRVVGAKEPNTSVPLQREVHNRFLHNAVVARKEAHQRFIEEMRTNLMGQFEHKVDRVLQDRWLFHAYRQQLAERLEACHQDVMERLQDAWAPVEAFAQEQLTRLRDFAPPLDMEAFAPVVHSVETFLEQAQRRVAREAEEAVNTLQLGGQPPVRLIPGGQTKRLAARTRAVATNARTTLTIDFPPPPLSAVLALAEAEFDEREQGAARLFNPQTGNLETSTAPVDHQLPIGEDAILNQLQAAQNTVTQWVRSLCSSTQRRLMGYAEALFQRQHGFLPGAAHEVLMHLEQIYLSLRGVPAAIPAPHMPERTFTPVQLLLSMQDPAFISYWNQQLVRRTANRTLGHLYEDLHKRFEDIRDVIAGEWEQCREALHESIQGIWSMKGRRLAMKKEIKWSVPWALSLMPTHLARPKQHLLQQCRVQNRDAAPNMPLFLGQRSDAFLIPHKQSTVKVPSELIADTLRDALRDETEALWNTDEVVRMPLRLRRQVVRRGLMFMALCMGLSIAGLVIWGTGVGSLALLASFLLCALGGIWAYLESFVNQQVMEQGTKQTDSVHELVRILLNERMDKLQRFLRSTIENASFRETIEDALLEGQAVPSPVYIRYHDLMARIP